MFGNHRGSVVFSVFVVAVPLLIGERIVRFLPIGVYYPCVAIAMNKASITLNLLALLE